MEVQDSEQSSDCLLTS